MRILVLGDSLGLPRPHRINNYSFNDRTLAVTYDQTYPAQLTKLLKGKLYNDFEVINRSKRSCTLRDIVSEFVDYFFFYEPNLIVLQIGIVDCWLRENNRQNVPIQDFELYITKILKWMSYRKEVKLIIVGINQTSNKMEERYPGINLEIKKYNSVYQKFVDNKTVFYIDTHEFIHSENLFDYLLPDDQHFNPNGNFQVAMHLSKFIDSLSDTDKGINLYSENDMIHANFYFELAYSKYPYYVDNLYNLLVTRYHLGKNFEDISAFLESFETSDEEFNQLKMYILNLDLVDSNNG